MLIITLIIVSVLFLSSLVSVVFLFRKNKQIANIRNEYVKRLGESMVSYIIDVLNAHGVFLNKKIIIEHHIAIASGFYNKRNYQLIGFGVSVKHLTVLSKRIITYEEIEKDLVDRVMRGERWAYIDEITKDNYTINIKDVVYE